MEREVYILDTSALISGFSPALADSDLITVSEVMEEVQSLSAKSILEAAVHIGEIEIKDPPEEAVSKVKDEVSVTGDKVSNTDIKILALAIHFRQGGRNPVIVTDDYAIQNLATLLEIPYSRMAKPGITTVFKWKNVCPSCGRTYPREVSLCEVCGTRIRREPKVEG